jgi:hypothetical protein
VCPFNRNLYVRHIRERRSTKGEEEKEELGLSISLSMLVTLQKLVKHRLAMPRLVLIEIVIGM